MLASFRSWCLALAVVVLGMSAEARAAAVTITSSSAAFNEQLAHAFATARGWVQKDKPLPCYWAAGTNRAAFYTRDTSHQTLGAHFLGLDAENFAMLKALAGSANASRKWYPLWSLTFAGEPFIKDYRGDTSFVREVPAAFELVQKAYEQYLWTGNQAYVSDPVLWDYYGHAVNDYVALHDANNNGIADEYGGGDIFIGAATYNENGENLIEAGDGIGSQYQAYVAYAGLLKAKGLAAESAAMAKRGEDFRQRYNTDWWSAEDQKFVRGLSREGKRLTNYGKESSFFIAMKLLLLPGPRADAFLDELKAAGGNFEAMTYMPEVFYPYGRVVEGWQRLSNVFVEEGKNNYPEISYTAIGNTIAGLMGVQGDAPAHAIATLPRLPSQLEWIEVDHLSVGQHEVSVRHEGCGRTTLAHVKGPTSLNWNAQFYGKISLRLDGVSVAAKTDIVNGREVTYVSRTLAVGTSSTVDLVGINACVTPAPPLIAPGTDDGPGGLGGGGGQSGGSSGQGLMGGISSENGGRGGAPSQYPSQDDPAVNGKQTNDTQSCACSVGRSNAGSRGFQGILILALVGPWIRRNKRPKPARPDI